MPFFVIKKGLVLLEWKYFPTPKILDPKKARHRMDDELSLSQPSSIKNYAAVAVSQHCVPGCVRGSQ